MLNFTKKTIGSKLLVFAGGFLLCFVLMLKGCIPLPKCLNGNIQYGTTSDTVYVEKDTTIYKSGKTITIHSTDTVLRPGDTVFIPDTNYNALKIQYINLANLYKIRNIYLDSLQLDTLGKIYIKDTIQYNTIASRTYRLKYKIPIVTNTTIVEPKNQFFLGGGLSIVKQSEVQIQVGGLFKPKKKMIFGLHAGVTSTNKLFYGGSAYYLINKTK